MSWTSFSRSLVRAAERAAKEGYKQQQAAHAMNTVQAFEEYIERITSLHKYCGEKVDWKYKETIEAPVEPEYEKKNEKKAKEEHDNYKPSIFARIFTILKENKLKRLKKKIEDGKEKDSEVYQRVLAEYEGKYKEWKETHDLAERINAKDANAYLEAINKHKPCTQIEEIGSHLNFAVDDNGCIEITIKTNQEDIVPKEIYKLTKTGKLSVRDMPKSKHNELYQDYISSSAIRAAREIFSLLPVDAVYVHVISDLLNASTGRIEEKPITSVAFIRETLDNLVINMIDPSDALKNFVHTMNFKKEKGFSPVEKVKKLKP